MLDGMILGMAPDGIRVLHEGEYLSPLKLPDCIQVKGTFGGTATIGHKKGKAIFKANPVNWLTGQNVFGSNDAYALALSFFKDLRDRRIVRFNDAAWQKIIDGEYDIHQLAFNKYLDTGDSDKLVLMDLLKVIFGGISTHAQQDNEMKWIMYPGHGFIINTRTVNLTIYDKTEQLLKMKPDWSSDYVPSLDVLRNRLRVEATLKYGHFSVEKRRMSWWLNKNWDDEAHKMIQKVVKSFGIDYLMRCPNVFAPDYTEAWKKRHKEVFRGWLDGRKISKMEAGNLLRLYGFDAKFSLWAHRNTLWTLSRPMTVTAPVVVDLVNTKRFPGIELLSPIYPVTECLVVGADRKTLTKIDRACRLARARD